MDAGIEVTGKWMDDNDEKVKQNVKEEEEE